MNYQEVLKKRHRKYIIIYLILSILLITLFISSISLGTISVSFKEVIDILLGKSRDNVIANSVVKDIRLPRGLGAMLSGAALSLAGLLMQIFFQNPIVDPFVLGISSGATLMVGLVTLTGITLGIANTSPYILVIAALIGSIGVMFIITGIASKVKNIITLLVIGLMLGYLCSAIINILVAFAEKESIRNFVVWTMGSFSGFTWDRVVVLAIVSIPIIVSSLLISKPLNALLLGEDYAKSMGVKIKGFRLTIIFLSSVLTGIVTAFSGPVAFIGLAVPHLARLCFGTDDNRVLIPGAILLGATLTVFCDLLARLALSPVELPISAVTSFVGAPIIIYLLMQRRESIS
ncbi:MAG: iron ABC transporter permease [Clostridiales bacterium]|nr:iron ABC transporter permease [Clostridiales bacterium]